MKQEEKLLQHAGEDGSRIDVVLLETAESSSYKRSLTLRVDFENKLWATPYAALVALSRVVVAHEDRGAVPPTRLLRMTEEELDWAVKVALQHRVVNVLNSLLKVRGQL